MAILLTALPIIPKPESRLHWHKYVSFNSI